jgi:hypothetical protein
MMMEGKKTTKGGAGVLADIRVVQLMWPKLNLNE